MALSAPVKALALLVFLAAIAGATYGVQTYVGDTIDAQIEAQTFQVAAPRAIVNATTGNDVSFVVAVTNRGSTDRNVHLEAEGVASGRSETTTLRANSTTAILLPVHVGDDVAAGAHTLDLRVVSGTRAVREREGALTLNVLSDAPGFAPGDSGEVIYIGRLSATGRVFNMNDPALVDAAFPKTDSYRFSQGLLPVETVPRPNVVPGLYEGMLGMQAGEHRSITFGPEKGYGNATEEQLEPRDEVIVRDLTLLNDVQRVARATFDEYVLETEQGTPDSFEAGDIFTLNQNGNDWPYRIVNITAQVVEYRLAATEGQGYTVYPFWPNASVVVSINDTHVSFRTTPTTEIGQPFTMKAAWPQMTVLREVDDNRAIVRHSPPVGYTYTTVTQLGQPREATIKELTEERIVVALPSPNPLAGKDLTFDVILVSLTKGE